MGVNNDFPLHTPEFPSRGIARESRFDYSDRMLEEGLNKLLENFTDAAKKHYGNRLVSIVVYGSVGRGTPRFDSDIDCLIICRDLPQGRTQRIEDFLILEEKLSPELKRLQQQGVSTTFSPILKTPEEVLKGSPLFLDMIEDAKILYDARQFFEKYLVNLKKRLKILGSKRVWKGNAWYWILKPGEVFEI